MWRATSALLLAAIVGGCGFAGVNPRSSGSATGPVGHQVAAGESIYSIASRYGTTPEELAARNGLGAPYQLTVGQRLVVPAPAQYVVQPGETIDMIARRYGTTPAELARINGIGAPYTVQAGRTLMMPQAAASGATGVIATSAAPTSSVQVSALPAPGAAAAATSTAVQPPAFGVVPGATAGTAQPPAFATGSVATGDPIPLVGTTGAGPAAPGQQVAALQAPTLDTSGLPAAAPPQAATSNPVIPPAQAEIAPDAPLPPAQTAAPPPSTAAGGLPVLSGSGFLRPVSGQVLSAFGQGTVPNDGINIAAPEGTPILAAEAGVVAYVGEDIDTFGNLVLIRHADGWVTAYGHAEAILVSEGDTVTRGQVIGRVGKTGAVSTAQLHFELRRGTEPVDPQAYLDG
ncbi:MAG: LysM peptidoglycan-binding domain-containing M23 family metallopeptidase [Alphaproteobacteria bacterium]